jgi:hypothetical protein
VLESGLSEAHGISGQKEFGKDAAAPWKNTWFLTGKSGIYLIPFKALFGSIMKIRVSGLFIGQEDEAIPESLPGKVG